VPVSVARRRIRKRAVEGVSKGSPGSIGVKPQKRLTSREELPPLPLNQVMGAGGSPAGIKLCRRGCRLGLYRFVFAINVKRAWAAISGTDCRREQNSEEGIPRTLGPERWFARCVGFFRHGGNQTPQAECEGVVIVFKPLVG
jgi:hypothetical protein